MGTVQEGGAFGPTIGIMWFMRGTCTQCGKLSPPVWADPADDDMEALARLRDLMSQIGWYFDVYRLFSGPAPGIKCTFRCKQCDKALRETTDKNKPVMQVLVTALDNSHAETTKGVT